MKKIFETFIETESKNINEGKEVDKAINQVIYLSANDMEDFFILLSTYFANKKDELDNMDAEGISKSLLNAYKIIKKRKSN